MPKAWSANILLCVQNMPRESKEGNLQGQIGPRKKYYALQPKSSESAGLVRLNHGTSSYICNTIVVCNLTI